MKKIHIQKYICGAPEQEVYAYLCFRNDRLQLLATTCPFCINITPNHPDTMVLVSLPIHDVDETLLLVLLDAIAEDYRNHTVDYVYISIPAYILNEYPYLREYGYTEMRDMDYDVLYAICPL